MADKPILVFQTDFTYKEGAVSAMYGVVKTVDRELEIFDGTHELPQYDTWSASYRLLQSLPFWPRGTIYVSVVDPGVGTDRRACVAQTKNGYYVVTPDNGTLTHIKRAFGIACVRQIDETINRLQTTRGVAIFHGRDLFGYTAARLASGIIGFEDVGPEYPVEEIVEHTVYEPEWEKGHVKGILEIDDPNFGNVWSNIPLETAQDAGFAYGESIRVCIRRDERVVFDRALPFYQSFGYAEKGRPMLYNNEMMRLALAVTQGSMAKEFGIGFGPEWKIDLYKT